MLEYNGIRLWWWCEAAMILMTIFNIYLVVCIGKFVLWMRSQKVKARMRPNSSSPGNVEIAGDEDVEFTAPGRRNKYKRWMNYMCLLAASQNLTKLLVDQFKFFHAWYARSDFICEVWYDITDIFLFGGIVICVYGFLWMKQWIFYQNPAVEGILYSKHIITFSKVFVIVILALSSFLTVVNTVANRYAAGNSTAMLNDTEALKLDEDYMGCVSIYEFQDPKDTWSLIAYVSLSSLFQAVLLTLFIYPLIKERIDKYKMLKAHNQNTSLKSLLGCCGKKDEPEASSLKDPMHSSKINNSALNSIRRAVTWTSICVITDVTTVSIFAQMGRGIPMVLTAVVTDFDLLCNVLCVVATYSRWRQILLPRCFANSNKKEAKNEKDRRKSSIPDHIVRFQPFLKKFKNNNREKIEPLTSTTVSSTDV